eukprot:TRINITY_DN39383_c0_g1_i4.p1 TRINITY_DN39383_c0_g1~~TRINITY_DN39383_c0_g1_i4.p1  ORF type:complete len:402 (+),score=77.72 TRINITY_DN39383_c0_g1_i4:117-1322(+)
MISSKAIITYKRKRQFSQLKLTHGLNGTNSTPETQRIISLTRFSKKTEPGQFSEKQKGHDQRSQEPKKAREINCLEGVEMGAITLRSQKVLQKLNCCENASNKSKDHSFQLDASFGKKPDAPSINLHSVVSGPNQAIARVEGSPDSQSNDMDLKISRSASADSTIEESCEVACQQGFFSQTSSENNDLLFKVKSNVLYTDSNPKKFNVPLITFSRRAKRHRVNGTDALKNVINEKRCSVVEWGNSAFTGSLHQRASQKCDSVDQSMAMAMPTMVQKINTLLVPGQDRQVKIVCKEDRNLQYSSCGCASKTKIGHCSDEEQETQGRKLVGSPVAEGVQEKNSDQCLPSLHSKADDNVQECHCPFKCRETSFTDMTNETKQLGCSVAHLEGSVTPGSLDPSRH